MALLITVGVAIVTTSSCTVNILIEFLEIPVGLAALCNENPREPATSREHTSSCIIFNSTLRGRNKGGVCPEMLYG